MPSFAAKAVPSRARAHSSGLSGCDAARHSRHDSNQRFRPIRPVHCKSLPAQETQAVLTARKLVQSTHHDTEMSLRGILRGFGLKVGKTRQRTFASRVRELVAGHPTLLLVAEALLAARAALGEQLSKLDVDRLQALVRRRLCLYPPRSACTSLRRGSGRRRGTPGRSWSGAARQTPSCPGEP